MAGKIRIGLPGLDKIKVVQLPDGVDYVQVQLHGLTVIIGKSPSSNPLQAFITIDSHVGHMKILQQHSNPSQVYYEIESEKR